MSDLEIIATTNGPFHVRGPVRIRRRTGELIVDVEDETWLCRCGHSADKPFCDGSHERCGFTDEPGVSRTGRVLDVAGEPVITVRPNGPYLIEGRAVVRNEAGAVLARGARLVLCRCGASGTKPFCDASHRRTGFAAD